MKKLKKYWLMKSEGDCYGIDDLKNDVQTAWVGVRNYQARNFMMNDILVGDVVFFYHSNGTKINPTGIYGIARVCSIAHPEETQFNKKYKHYDPKATKEKPIWHCVDIKFVKKLKNPTTLSGIKFEPSLAGIMVAQTGSRLSIQPVSIKHGEYLINNLK